MTTMSYELFCFTWSVSIDTLSIVGYCLKASAPGIRVIRLQDLMCQQTRCQSRYILAVGMPQHLVFLLAVG